MKNEQLFYMLALTHVPGVADSLAKNLIAYCGGPKEVFSMSKSALLRVPGIGPKVVSELCAFKDYNVVEKEFMQLERDGVKMIPIFHESYPWRLKSVYNSPLFLYARGGCDLNSQRTVAIVGTRKPSVYGRHLCQGLVKDLVKYECTIVSGLAYGIDGIAHQTALESKLPTAAVLAHGLHLIYPSKHGNMARRMIESNGAVLSQFNYFQKPDRENFPKRNGVIAGLVDALVVVESPKKGGSMISAEYAWDYDRPIFVFPGRTSDRNSGGCLSLIKQHKASLIESGEDLARNMNWTEEKSARQLPLFELSSDEMLIVSVLQHEKSLDIEKLHHKSGLGSGKLAYLLLELEFKKMVICRPGKLYELA